MNPTKNRDANREATYVRTCMAAAGFTTDPAKPTCASGDYITGFLD
jgi:hypothetical protein